MFKNMIPNRTMLLIEMEKVEDVNDQGFVSIGSEPKTRKGKVIACGGKYVLPSGVELDLCAEIGDTVVFRSSIVPFGQVDEDADIICINDKEILCTIKGS